MSLKGQKCWGTYQDGANIASKWRIDNVFSDMRIEKRGQPELDFWSTFILWLYDVESCSDHIPDIPDSPDCFQQWSE